MSEATKLALKALEMFVYCDAFAEEFTPRTAKEKMRDDAEKEAVYEAAEAAIKALKGEA